MQDVKPVIEETWLQILKDEFQSDYFSELKRFLLQEKKQHAIYPPGAHIFAAFNQTPFRKVKVVILGQDPYHGTGQAHGLCFSVPDGVRIPPSLINIYKEIEDDLGYTMPTSGNLGKWARQGVLLLNATLTVRANNAGSHQNKGWEKFTDAVIKHLSSRRNNIIFLLWGNYAQAKEIIIDTSRHHVLKAPHPSPLSANRGFFGCKHFSKTNELLKKLGETGIDWRLSH